MRIIHLATDGDGTGVAIAARRLHQGLLELGHDSVILAKHLTSSAEDPRIRIHDVRLPLWRRARRRLRYMLIQRSHKRVRKPAGFSDDRAPMGRELVDALPPCDVITVHATGNWLDFRSFFATAPHRAPVVRVMHDMNFFTGGCHYDQACGRYIQRCGCCPQLASHDERDFSRQVWERKHSLLAAPRLGRVFFVSPSRWLAGEARRSSLLRSFTVTVIPNGVDLKLYVSHDRRASRNILGIPVDAKVILFVAEPLTRGHKGLGMLTEALHTMESEKPLLVTVGSGSSSSLAELPHFNLGHVADEWLMPVIYSAADVYVIPSLQDNCPQTALEALACGVPVVGFATGGVLDMVRSGYNGALAPVGQIRALADAIEGTLADDSRRESMGRNARRSAEEEFSLGLQAKRYAALYEAILSGEIEKTTVEPEVLGVSP